MSHDCLKAEEIDRLVDDELAREHARECPRCHELLASYRQFVSGRELPGSDVGDAERRLGDFLEELPARPMRRARRGIRPTAWVLAAAAAGAIFFLWPRDTEVPERPVLRNEAAVTFSLLAPERSDSGWSLRWNAFEGADAYELRLYSTGLEELRRVGPIAGVHTTLEFPEEDGIVWLWRVVALRGGDVVGETDVGTLQR